MCSFVEHTYNPRHSPMVSMKPQFRWGHFKASEPLWTAVIAPQRVQLPVPVPTVRK